MACTAGIPPPYCPAFGLIPHLGIFRFGWRKGPGARILTTMKLLFLLFLTFSGLLSATEFRSQWGQQNDAVWLGSDY